MRSNMRILTPVNPCHENVQFFEHHGEELDYKHRSPTFSPAQLRGREAGCV